MGSKASKSRKQQTPSTESQSQQHSYPLTIIEKQKQSQKSKIQESDLLALVKQFSKENPTKILSQSSSSRLSLINPSIQQLAKILEIVPALQDLSLVFNDRQTDVSIKQIKGVQPIQSHQLMIEFFSVLKYLTVDQYYENAKDLFGTIERSNYRDKVTLTLNKNILFDKIALNHGIENPINFKIYDIKKLPNSTIQRLADTFQNIRQISIMYASFENSEFFVQVLNKLHSLTTLIIWNSLRTDLEITGKDLAKLRSPVKAVALTNMVFDESSFCMFLQNNTSLQKVQFQQCNIGEQHFEQLPYHCGLKVQKLGLKEKKYQKFITHQGISQIVSKFPNLLQLKLYECQKIANQSLKLICTKLKQLRNLDISYCNMDNKGLIYIKGLKYLKQFCLFGNYKTSKMIVAIDLNMKEIRGAKQSIYQTDDDKNFSNVKRMRQNLLNAFQIKLE